jgi:hypothetical protein
VQALVLQLAQVWVLQWAQVWVQVLVQALVLLRELAWEQELAVA